MRDETKIIRLLSRAKVHCDADMCDDAVVEIESALALLGEQVDKPVIMARELSNAFKFVEKQCLESVPAKLAGYKKLTSERVTKIAKARNK